MSTAERRRNGSEASCEPCRKRKQRCGHEQPVCAACRHRKLESRCWYHPAPLSKPRGNIGTHPRRVIPRSPAPSVIGRSGSGQGHELAGSVRSRPGSILAGTGAPERALRIYTWPVLTNDFHGCALQANLPENNTRNAEAYREQLIATEEILSHFKQVARIEKLVQDGISFRRIAVVPPPVVRRFVASVKSITTAWGYGGNNDTSEASSGSKSIESRSQLARDVIQASSSAVNITPGLDAEAFCALFCGANLRVETLGLVCAMAARCHFDFISHWDAGEKDDGFTHQLFRCASLSLQLARELSPQVNDVIMWLAYEVMQCCTSLEGSASLSVWRKLGDIVTDMYVMGLHRETTHSDEAVPFFLSEYRKRLFAIIFNVDKAWSAIFNQPPRIPSRYADCKPPLDISDDDLFSLEPGDLEKLLSRLTPDGWNKEGGYRTTTWSRLRYILGEIRGQFIEAHHLTQPVDGSELRNLSIRCHEVWNSLPPHLRCGQDPGLMSSDLPNIVRQMLMRAHLSFVHIDFHIFRSIGKDGDAAPSPELLEISARMLHGVMMVVMDRGNKQFLCDLAEDLLFYALPCAVVLITALQDAMRDPARSLPSSISKAILVRNISVLVSQLEALASPDQPHYRFCAQAAKSMSRKLDQVLEHSMSGPVIATRAENDKNDNTPGDLQQCGPSTHTITTTTHRPGGEQQPSSEPALGPSGDVVTPCMDLSDFDSSDFETWATNWGFDLGTTASEWGMF